MEADIAFVQAQLWAVISLLVAILVGNLLCNLRHRTTATPNSVEPDFKDLYERDRLDELIETARSHLRVRPNSTHALYWGGQALMAKKIYPEAHEWFRRLSVLDPALREQLSVYLDETGRGPSS